MRLKTSNINRAINLLNGSELSLYIYIAQHSDNAGFLQNLSMNEFCMLTTYCKQSFYKALYSLEQKEFISISYTTSHHNSFNVLLSDNFFKSFSDTSNSYINLHYDFLRSTEFHKLNVNLKKYLIRSYGFSNNSRLVSADNIKQFNLKAEDLEPFFDIQEWDINESGEVIYKIYFKKKYRHTSKSIQFQYFRYKLEKYLNNIKAEYTNELLNDATQVLCNYHTLPAFIGIAASHIINKNKGRYILQPKLLNSEITRLKKQYELQLRYI